MYDMYTWQSQSLFIRDKYILSWERMLHKDYDCEGFICKKLIISDREPHVPRRQDELIRGKPPIVK
jgi:hypothetical protein